MKIELKSYSKPVNSESDTGSESNTSLLDLVAYYARVSNPANQNNTETNEKLVSYLIQHEHWSPLEMVSICLEIETTRDIARQILRHRSFSFQEYSQRYAVADLGVVYREARMQDTKNRQSSIPTQDPRIQDEWDDVQERVAVASRDAYAWALDNGIAKEQARAVLPEGMTTSRLYMNGTLRSWVHYIQLRSGNGTQKEHREIALKCAEQIEPIFPMIKNFVNRTV
jgi:thymidylate synthase (FAD)